MTSGQQVRMCLIQVKLELTLPGIAVSASGRLFSNYPLGLDPENTRYQVAELVNSSSETPYPSVEINTPPDGPYDYSSYPARSKGLPDYLIGVQSVVIDAQDRLWILDTGRAALPNGTLTASQYGGPKLIGVDLQSNSVIKTILFPPEVAYPESYLNDIRFDLRFDITESGQGVGYITDSSNEGRNGLIIVDLGTGKSWRHLEGTMQVRGEDRFFATIWGQPLYTNPGTGSPIRRFSGGADGIAISPDGETLYFCPVASRYLYAVPTARLLDSGPASELLAQASVMNLGQKGHADGLESDSNGLVYAGSIETNSIVIFNPANASVSTYARDPRIGWPDTFSIGTDGYLYFTANQLFRMPGMTGGEDLRQKPFMLYRVPLAEGGQKIGAQTVDLYSD